MSELPADRIREIESVVSDWLHEADVPGASVVIVDVDGECYAEGFGARNLESNEPATPDTLYGMASISKSFTALGILQLAEDGALSVEDSVDDYVDYFEDAPGESITIEELLTHTSGMPATASGVLSQLLDGIPAGVADWDDRERWIRDAADLRVTDEERFFYYNAGYGVLGAVIEAVDGRSYAEYVGDEILEPLGMERSTFEREDFEDADDAMTGYVPDEDAPEERAFPFTDLIYASGGLVSSVREMGAYVRAMMTDGSADGARVCEPESVERLQSGRAVRQEFLHGGVQQYGYGWMRQPVLDDELVGHGGSLLVSTAYMGFLEDEGLGIAVACNTTADPHPMHLGPAVLAAATGRDPTEVPAFALREKCEAVAGTYETFREGMTATVEHDGGQLSITLESSFGEEDLAVFPETLDPDDHQFYTVGGAGQRLPVEFDLDGDRADMYFRRNRFRRTIS